MLPQEHLTSPKHHWIAENSQKGKKNGLHQTSASNLSHMGEFDSTQLTPRTPAARDFGKCTFKPLACTVQEVP